MYCLQTIVAMNAAELPGFQKVNSDPRGVRRYRNTWVNRRNGETFITLHRTDIVSYTGTTVTLNSGGWQTVTTKKRMNEVADEFGLRFNVYQHKHQWYVATLFATHEYYDGMTIDRKTGDLI